MSDPKPTTSVRLAGPTNSTTFTGCCGIAVIDEERCPECGAIVLPEGREARWRAAFGPSRYGEKRDA